MNKSIVIRLFWFVVLVTVVITCCLSSSLRTATPTANATATPTANATASAPLVHTRPSAYWLSLWYRSHPQHHPTESEIKAMRANARDIVPGYKIPLTAANIHTRTSAYWLSLWYRSHPQHHPTESEIKAMRANARDIVPGYKIPLTAATKGLLKSSSTKCQPLNYIPSLSC
jgi:proteasome lid subunit RPN8/RPN11